jgi:hypothetical protein
MEWRDAGSYVGGLWIDGFAGTDYGNCMGQDRLITARINIYGRMGWIVGRIRMKMLSVTHLPQNKLTNNQSCFNL